MPYSGAYAGEYNEFLRSVDWLTPVEWVGLSWMIAIKFEG